MPSFVIENFSNGLDRRRSKDTAPPGSLRTLRNGFVNEGGEVQKRKAFVLHPTLTAYGQTANYKGRITGPHRAEAQSDTRYFFRHRHDSLPGSPWSAGSGSVAVSLSLNSRPNAIVWAMKSALALTNFGIMFRANMVAHFGDKTQLLEDFFPDGSASTDHQHISVTLATDGEPTAGAAVTDNNNLPALMVLNQKAYVGGRRTVKASKVGDPTDMAGTGSGAFDTRSQSMPIGSILGFGDYFGQLAVFGTRGVQFWQVDPDFAKLQFLRTVPANCVSGRSIIGYGDGDLAFLAQDGIRSLQARDSSNIATTSDFGSPIDRLVREALSPSLSDIEEVDGLSNGEVDNARFYNLAPSVLHPETGQLWMSLKDQIYVFSHYSSASVSAWSTFDLPAVQPENVSTRNGALKSRWMADVCQFNSDVMFRNYADEVFIYGGVNGDAYDASMCEVVTPHMDMGLPGAAKMFRGVDLACQGEWTIEISVDPTQDPLVWEEIATVTNSTHRLTGLIGFEIEASHIALRLTSVSASPARLGQIALYYDQGKGK